MGDEIHLAILTGVSLAVERLNNDELAALYLCVANDADPRGKEWYERARSLFTEAQGTRLHPHTMAALAAIVHQRLGR